MRKGTPNAGSSPTYHDSREEDRDDEEDESYGEGCVY